MHWLAHSDKMWYNGPFHCEYSDRWREKQEKVPTLGWTPFDPVFKKTKGRRCEWSPFKAQYRISWNQKQCRAELRISDHGSGLRRIGKCHLNKLWRKNLLYQIRVPDSKDKASLEVELSKSTAGIRALGGIYTFWTMRSILSQIKTILRSAK